MFLYLNKFIVNLFKSILTVALYIILYYRLYFNKYSTPAPPVEPPRHRRDDKNNT